MNPATLGRLRQWVRGVPRRMASVKAGSVLIIAIFLFTLVAAFFPYTEAAGFIRRAGRVFGLEGISQVSELEFQERFESVPFLALAFALGLSLCLSLYFRIRNEFLHRRAARKARPPEGEERQRSPMILAACRVLERHGYRTSAAGVTGAWQIHGIKGDGGALGSVLFHFGILLVLVAVVLSASASFRASVKLTEGQAFDARTDSYGSRKAGRWYSPPKQPLTFRLVRVEPDYEVNGAKTVASIVEPMLEGKASRFLAQAPVYIGHGLGHAGVTIHQGRETGYAPLVIVEDAAGARLIEGYIQLATVADPGKEGYLDIVYTGSHEVSLELELLPDAVYRNGAYVARSSALKKPVLHAVVHERGKVVLNEFIPVTRDVSAGGYTVYFGEVRRWSQLDVVDAPGMPLLMAATLLGSLGLALRLLRVRRRIVVSLPAYGSGPIHAWQLSGSSEKFQRQFAEELNEIRAALAERLAAAGRE